MRTQMGVVAAAALVGLAGCGPSEDVSSGPAGGSSAYDYPRATWTPPEGFIPYQTARGDNLAFQWVTPSDCRTGVMCFSMNVVVENGCARSLYAAITLLDSAGNNVGWTNDTAQGVMPGENTRLVFSTYERYAESARIAEVSCY